MKFKYFFSLLLIAGVNTSVISQKIYSKNGSVSFFSKATIENISAMNNEVVCLLNEETGELQFSVLIKSFHFKKSLMEEHFNENYLESDKYPKASFKGKLNDMSKVNFSADGTYQVEVSGDLTMHGVSNKITKVGSIIIKAGVISSSCDFKVKLADYKISIPSIVKDNIAETVDITINCEYNHKL